MPGEDLPAVLRVAVGSTNPVKVRAVSNIVRQWRPQAEIVSVAVASGVPDQPWGDDETIQGAETRARAAREVTGADLGIGLEGGVVERASELRTCAWAAVSTRDGRTSVGGSLSMPLPPAIAALVRSGVELGSAMDQVTGTEGTKHALGAVGILTGGLIDRTRAYETLVAYALSPLLGAEYSARQPVGAER